MKISDVSVLKKIKKYQWSKYMLMLLLVLAGCIDEDPKLVNPTPQKESVLIRFLNFAGDKEARTMSMRSGNEISDIAYYSTSTAIRPPSDSVFVSIEKGAANEYDKYNKVKFVRNTNYTFVALPSADKAPVQKNVDTVVVFTTSIGLPDESTNSYLKLFNAFPDSTYSFSVSVGCPSGSEIFSSVQYRGFSEQQTLSAGSFAVSVKKVSTAGTEIVGIFQLDLLHDKQYTIIVARGSDGNPEILLLNENDKEITAISKPQSVTERLAYVRSVNLSEDIINTYKAPNEIVKENLSPYTLSSYQGVSSCESNATDSIYTMVNGENRSYTNTSLVVNKKYTTVTFDDLLSKASKTVMFEPLTFQKSTAGNAVIRVLNADFMATGLTLSIASRNYNNSSNYVAGEKLASELTFGNVANTYLLPLSSGVNYVPLTLFSSKQPASLYFQGYAKLEPDKSYIIVILNNTGTNRIAVIEDGQENSSVDFVDEAPFMQCANAMPNNSALKLSFAPYLSNLYFPYTSTITTLGNSGTNALIFGNSSCSVNMQPQFRYLVVAAGNGTNPDLFYFQGDKMPETNQYYRLRFINASPDYPKISVRLDSTNLSYDHGNSFAEALVYGGASYQLSMTLDKYLNFYFVDTDNNTLIYRLNNFNPVFGKSYTFILTADKSKNKAEVLPVQDY